MTPTRLPASTRPRWDADATAGRARRVGGRSPAGARQHDARWCCYFGWLLQPDRVGNPVLFGVLLAAELFNVVQALGFWWTCLGGRRRRRRARRVPSTSPTGVRRRVHPDLQRARRGRRGDRRRGDPPARRRGARRPARRRQPRGDGAPGRAATASATCAAARHEGAKAGNINHALGRTNAAVRARPRLRPRAPSRAARAHAARVRRPIRRLRADAAVLRQRAAPTAWPARRGASRRCSSGRSPAARTPTRDVLLRHQRRVPAPGPRGRSAASRRAR